MKLYPVSATVFFVKPCVVRGFDESGVCFADQNQNGRCDGDWGQWVAVSVSIIGGGRVSSTELIFSISLKSYVVISFLSWG